MTRLEHELTTPSGIPRYLHLATHGFFVPPKSMVSQGPKSGLLFTDPFEQRSYGRNLLLHAGVALSGANTSPAQGVCTAEEVNGLDLRGTELVVLSACETAVGLMPFNEGMFGLQQAFHTAGARTVVSSLWRVQDPATSVLMEQFYKRLWAEKPLPKLEALRQAQLTVLRNPDLVRTRTAEMQKKGIVKRGPSLLPEILPDGGKSESRSPPAWWAAFVLSGDYR
jgi:CHAT domain-containing protein